MSLTVKQEAFAIALAGGATASDAYRKAYNAKAMSGKQVHTEASKLAHHPEVARRISDGRATIVAKVIEKTAIDKVWITSKLVDIVESAMADGVNLGSAVRSLELLGKEIGMFVDRRMEVKPDPLDGFSAQELRKILGILDEQQPQPTAEAGSSNTTH